MSENPPMNYNDSSSLNKFQRFFYEYGRYHRNPLNVFIHIICIPIITLTYFKLLDYVAFDYFKCSLTLNPLLLIWVIWTPIYLYVDFFTGFIVSAMYPLVHYFTLGCQPTLFGLNYNQTVLFVHCFAWIMQFIGHGFFEKRKPALMDNLLLIFNAPVFVVIELLYFVGYRKREIDETMHYIEANIFEHRNRNRKIVKSK